MFSASRLRSPMRTRISIAASVAVGSALLFCVSGQVARAQMVEGAKIPGFAATFGLPIAVPGTPVPPPLYTARLYDSSVPGNVLWQGEQPTFTLQIASDQPLKTTGKVEVIQYGTKGRPGDIWVPDMFRIGVAATVPIQVDIPAKGHINVVITPRVPDTLGAYGVVTDLGAAGRVFVFPFVRTFASEDMRVQYPKFCLDALPLPVLKRLGVHAIRYGAGYKPSEATDYAQWWQQEQDRMKAYNDANISVLYMIGGPSFYGPEQPMRRPRPWLNDKDEMLDTKFDLAWLPSYDDDFQQECYKVASTLAWPKGPINAFSLWNEPWEGLSISGWGADMTRYRELFMRMAKGVDQARQNDGIDCLIGGCDSSSNAHDKLFADGKDTFLPYFDFLSIHYQGLSPDSTFKQWVDRKNPRGRVKIWDTESWVANTDDRVAAVVASDRAAGYDRAMGVYGGNIADQDDVTVFGDDGKPKRVSMVNAWSVAASVGASQHFIGERDFKEILFKNGLPWVFTFNGMNGKDGKPDPDDGTVVVVGDIGEEFGADWLLFRTARGLAEIKHKAELRKQFAALPASATDKDRADLQKQIDTPETLSGATMTISGGRDFSLFDFYGNPVPTRRGQIVVPLDGRGFFLRTDGTPGSMDRLIAAIKQSRIDGIEPLAIVAHDMIAGVETHPVMHLSLTNILNRPITGSLKVSLAGLTVTAPVKVSLQPWETLDVPVTVSGTPNATNSYPMTVRLEAGKDGFAQLDETVHVNLIAHKTITVDGNLDDWKDVLPQTIITNGPGAPTVTESAWYPFKNFDQSVTTGFATGYLAFDDQNFYFAAKVADATPDPGMPRFETRNDDEFYYPEKTYSVVQSAERFTANWNGQIQPKYTETYTFTVNTSGPTRVTVNGKRIVDDQTSHPPKELSGDVALQAGRRVDISVDFKHDSGPAVVQLFWQSPTQARELVPAAALYPGRDATAAAGGLSARYNSQGGVMGEEIRQVDPQINMAFDNATDAGKGVLAREEWDWPAGVRRYSYRKDPELPAGNFPRHDNVQIAFNVLPADQKAYYPNPPGAMPGFVNYQDTDYEYALNPVAAKYGGGVEVWRMQTPGMPRKEFYPRQPASPFDGPVKDARLVIRQDGNTRIVEAAIPWTEIPDVKKCMDAGQPIKFSFRVNDNSNPACMELSNGRSVAKRNPSFHVDWVENRANELQFGWGK